MIGVIIGLAVNLVTLCLLMAAARNRMNFYSIRSLEHTFEKFNFRALLFLSLSHIGFIFSLALILFGK